jgi:ATP-dependent protease HslVU (ClpYQ) peptidase subunit
MGQILGHSLKIPDRGSDSLEAFMQTQFIDAVRACMKAGGYAKIESGVDHGGTFLVALEGRLFTVHSDFQVFESRDPYDAVGCGQDIALGAMYATSMSHANKPRERIKLALDAAARFSAGVHGPMRILCAKATT